MSVAVASTVVVRLAVAGTVAVRVTEVVMVVPCEIVCESVNRIKRCVNNIKCGVESFGKVLEVGAR